jgi:ubiquinone/menaquinone biosynthesis C-methylase UbiE
MFRARAAHVTALDKSPDMLRIARTRLQDLPSGKVIWCRAILPLCPLRMLRSTRC